LGTLTFYAVTSGESGIYIEDVEFSNDSKMVTAEDNVSEFQRKSRYLGPRFDDLDEELQFSFSEFLEERGLNENFCNFAQDYAEWKEQNEYKRWLNNVKSFVTK
jgi:complement component 1 Q subcomponent-binding protein